MKCRAASKNRNCYLTSIEDVGKNASISPKFVGGEGPKERGKRSNWGGIDDSKGETNRKRKTKRNPSPCRYREQLDAHKEDDPDRKLRLGKPVRIRDEFQ